MLYKVLQTLFQIVQIGKTNNINRLNLVHKFYNRKIVLRLFMITILQTLRVKAFFYIDC